jgi:glucose-1-phosphate cytidylyltransferase
MTKVVILAGGLGTRLREETEFKPKPMVEIGGMPIIWHIISNFINSGFKDFIIATGYKGHMIKEYFLNLETYLNDFTVKIDAENGLKIQALRHLNQDINISVIDTGLNTMTGGRIYKLQEFIGHENFICTYGDGLSNINPKELIKFHLAQKTFATVTAVKPRSRFGQLEVSTNGIVKSFREKPIMDDWVNGGFFVFSKEIFNYLSEEDVLEERPLHNLVSDGQISAFKHNGFWYPMDTYREFVDLNKMWDEGNAPWIIKKVQ